MMSTSCPVCTYTSSSDDDMRKHSLESHPELLLPSAGTLQAVSRGQAHSGRMIMVVSAASHLTSVWFACNPATDPTPEAMLDQFDWFFQKLSTRFLMDPEPAPPPPSNTAHGSTP